MKVFIDGRYDDTPCSDMYDSNVKTFINFGQSSWDMWKWSGDTVVTYGILSLIVSDPISSSNDDNSCVDELNLLIVKLDKSCNAKKYMLLKLSITQSNGCDFNDMLNNVIRLNVYESNDTILMWSFLSWANIKKFEASVVIMNINIIMNNCNILY